MKGKLMNLMGSLTRRLGLLFDHSKDKDIKEEIVDKYRIYDVLLEIVWNLVGAEREWVGFPKDEATKSVEAILSFLKNCEEKERREFGSAIILESVITNQLDKAKLVNKGSSMVAWMALEIEKKLERYFSRELCENR